MHASAESAADTAAIVEALSGVTEAGGVTVLCGQEAAAVEKAGLYGKVSHVSFEDLLLGRPLAGVEALGDK
jgi:3-phosphoglycerate kinase